MAATMRCLRKKASMLRDINGLAAKPRALDVSATMMFPLSANCDMSRACDQMIIHHPRGLHEGVHNRRPDKIEAALAQVL